MEPSLWQVLPRPPPQLHTRLLCDPSDLPVVEAVLQPGVDGFLGHGPGLFPAWIRFSKKVKRYEIPSPALIRATKTTATTDHPKSKPSQCSLPAYAQVMTML